MSLFLSDLVSPSQKKSNKQASFTATWRKHISPCRSQTGDLHHMTSTSFSSLIQNISRLYRKIISHEKISEINLREEMKAVTPADRHINTWSVVKKEEEKSLNISLNSSATCCPKQHITATVTVYCLCLLLRAAQMWGSAVSLWNMTVNRSCNSFKLLDNRSKRKLISEKHFID